MPSIKVLPTLSVSTAAVIPMLNLPIVLNSDGSPSCIYTSHPSYLSFSVINSDNSFSRSTLSASPFCGLFPHGFLIFISNDFCVIKNCATSLAWSPYPLLDNIGATNNSFFSFYISKSVFWTWFVIIYCTLNTIGNFFGHLFQCKIFYYIITTKFSHSV